jgi:formylglycine-generating enzyme required for sulfatase activity
MPSANVILSAEFEPLPPGTYSITAAASSHGTVIPDVDSAPAGTTVTLMVTPDTDYVLQAGTVKYSYGGTDYGTAGSGLIYTFTMPSANVILSAEFEAATYTVSGTITTNNPGGAASGASVQLKQGGSPVGDPVTTEGSGAYTISNVLAGTGYTVEVSLSGYVTGIVPPFNVVAANVTGKDLTLIRELIIYTVDGLTFKMARVPGGVPFPTGESDGGTATVAGAYEIGETEVTYELWHKVREWAESHEYTFSGNPGREGSSPTSENTTPGVNRQEPVTMVTWFDAVVWLNALTEWVNAKTPGSSLMPVYYYDDTYAPGKVAKNSNPALNFAIDGGYPNAYEKPGATGFRLPTSKEWELAARWRGSDPTNTVIGPANPYFTKGNSASGATADYTNTTATEVVAWYDGNATKTGTVMGKAANALGLYDMSGNVFEWCFEFRYSPDFRIMRGGSWNPVAADLQVGYENIGAGRSDYTGFRPVRTAD